MLGWGVTARIPLTFAVSVIAQCRNHALAVALIIHLSRPCDRPQLTYEDKKVIQ
jgi:hypothetical protein